MLFSHGADCTCVDKKGKALHVTNPAAHEQAQNSVAVFGFHHRTDYRFSPRIFVVVRESVSVK